MSHITYVCPRCEDDSEIQLIGRIMQLKFDETNDATIISREIIQCLQCELLFHRPSVDDGKRVFVARSVEI